MKIEKDCVVRFHYIVSEIGQAPFESSKERNPLAILIGHGNIIPGLENAMLDKRAGESFGVDVKAADAYGEYREGLTQRIRRRSLEIPVSPQGCRWCCKPIPEHKPSLCRRLG